MFWLGFWCGVIAVLITTAIIATIFFIFAYKGCPMAEDEE